MNREGGSHKLRSSPRVSFIRSVRIKTGPEHSFLEYAAKDISTGGLRISSFDFFPINKWLDLQFKLSDADSILEVRGRVAWVHFDPVTHTYQTGIDFSSASAYKRGVIRGFIQSQ